MNRSVPDKINRHVTVRIKTTHRRRAAVNLNQARRPTLAHPLTRVAPQPVLQPGPNRGPTTAVKPLLRPASRPQPVVRIGRGRLIGRARAHTLREASGRAPMPIGQAPRTDRVVPATDRLTAAVARTLQAVHPPGHPPRSPRPRSSRLSRPRSKFHRRSRSVTWPVCCKRARSI